MRSQILSFTLMLGLCCSASAAKAQSETTIIQTETASACPAPVLQTQCAPELIQTQCQPAVIPTCEVPMKIKRIKHVAYSECALPQEFKRVKQVSYCDVPK